MLRSLIFRVTAPIAELLHSSTTAMFRTRLGVSSSAQVTAEIDSQLTAKAVRVDAQTLSAAAKLQARTNIEAMQSLVSGRTLSADATVLAADYGTIVSLAGHTLTAGAGVNSQVRGSFGVTGPGIVTSAEQGDIRLIVGEYGLVVCVATGDIRVVSALTAPGNRSTFSSTPPTEPAEGDEWASSITLRSYRWVVREAGDTAGAWVEFGVPAAFGSMAQKTVTSASYVMVSEDSNTYLRFTATEPKTITIPEESEDFGLGNWAMTTLSNSAASGDITITGASVAVQVAGDSLTVPPDAALTLVRVGTNSYEVR